MDEPLQDKENGKSRFLIPVAVCKDGVDGIHVKHGECFIQGQFTVYCPVASNIWHHQPGASSQVFLAEYFDELSARLLYCSNVVRSPWEFASDEKLL
ncbi:MAG: hypothetical protein WB444_03075 [Gallionella sp.]